MLLFLWKVYEQNKTFLKEWSSLSIIGNDLNSRPVSGLHQNSPIREILLCFFPQQSLVITQVPSITCTLEFHLVTLSHWGQCPVIQKGPQLQSSTSHVQNVHNGHHRYHGNIYRSPVIHNFVLLSQCNDHIHPVLAGHCSFTHLQHVPPPPPKRILISTPLLDVIILYYDLLFSSQIFKHFCLPMSTFFFFKKKTCLFLMSPWEKARKSQTAYFVIKKKDIQPFRALTKTRHKWLWKK